MKFVKVKQYLGKQYLGRHLLYMEQGRTIWILFKQINKFCAFGSLCAHTLNA
jgi:hypothetical protein